MSVAEGAPLLLLSQALSVGQPVPAKALPASQLFE